MDTNRREHFNTDLKPWNQPECEQIHSRTEGNSSKHNESSMPAAGAIVWAAHLDYALEHHGIPIQAAREQSNVSCPGKPTLDPGQKSPVPRRREGPGPVVLSTRNGLDGCQLAESGSLGERSGGHYKVAPEPCCRAAVGESEIHVPEMGSKRLAPVLFPVGVPAVLTLPRNTMSPYTPVRTRRVEVGRRDASCASARRELTTHLWGCRRLPARFGRAL